MFLSMHCDLNRLVVELYCDMLDLYKQYITHSLTHSHILTSSTRGYLDNINKKNETFDFFNLLSVSVKLSLQVLTTAYNVYV